MKGWFLMSFWLMFGIPMRGQRGFSMCSKYFTLCPEIWCLEISLSAVSFLSYEEILINHLSTMRDFNDLCRILLSKPEHPALPTVSFPGCCRGALPAQSQVSTGYFLSPQTLLC